MKFVLPLALALLASDTDCDKQKTPDVVSPRPMVLRHVARRFELVEKSQPGVALDTVTGQYCRTWDWAYVNRPEDKSFSTLQLCIDIYRGYPSEEIVSK